MRRAGKLTYDASVSIGVVSITAGVYLRFGGAIAAMIAGTLLVVLSIYAAERLSGHRRRRENAAPQVGGPR